MIEMKQNIAVTSLRFHDFMTRNEAWGRDEGKLIHDKMEPVVKPLPDGTIIRVSLAEVDITDASVARETVIALALTYRRILGFSLVDVETEALQFNWDAAALKLGQPLIIWSGNCPELIGPKPPQTLGQVLDYILASESVTTSQVAIDLKLSVPNASTKLKSLWSHGYVLRRMLVALSGGHEYEYFRIR